MNNNQQKAELVSWETLRQDCKYSKDDNNDGFIFGLAYIDDDEISDYEWFKTEEERQNSIKENNLYILE